MNQVSWKDYEGVEGFGASTQQELADLNKALAAGQDINPPGSAVAGDGFAMRVESLERTMKNVTFRMENLKLYKALPKLAAYNTVEEHNEISRYGQNVDAGFISEGDLPGEDDSIYERKFAIVKYLGTTRRVTHVMSLVKPAHGNIIAQETVNGTMHLLRVLEQALFYGNSDLSALQFDGYEKLIADNSPATNIIDLRGKPLSEDYLTDGCLTASDAPNYGRITDLHAGPKVIADLVKSFYPKERHSTLDAGPNHMIGFGLKGFTSQSGDVMFNDNVFITDGGAPNAAAVGDAAKRPCTPTISAPATTPADAASQFAADDAGDYFYSVVACNRYGRSMAVAVDVAAIAIVAGDKMTFGVTPGGATSVEWYELYRTAKGGAVGSQRRILRVKNTAGAGAQTIEDLNANLPFCSSAFMFQQNLENMSLKQLAPMLKIPLATVDSSIRWMQLLYCVPVLYTPGKNILFKNVGRAQGYVGAP